MPNRTKRAISQRIGSSGERWAAVVFEKLGSWIARRQEEDFGIDLELELSDPDPSGCFIKCQVKSFKGKPSAQSVRLELKFVRYAYECRVPVILLLVEVESGSAWYCWLQGHVESSRLQRSIYNAQKPIVIPAAAFQKVDSTANGLLIRIARGAHPIARSMHIRDLLRFGLDTHDYEVIESASSLLGKFGKEVSYFPLDPVLDEALALGMRIRATLEGNAITNLLYALARSFGDHFSTEQIHRLVIREDGYSRTGINALSIIYDKFPEYVRSLQLGESFRDHPDGRVAYFCGLREKYIDVPVMHLMDPSYECTLNGFRLNRQEYFSWLNLWANRGDSAILDLVSLE